MSSSAPAAPLPPAPPLSAAAPGAALDRSLLGGIAWTGGVRWISQLLGWTSTLVVARLLTPADYGIVGMAAVFVGLVTLLSEFGLGAAVVMLRDLDPAQARQINTLSVMLGVASAAVTCAAALPMARLMDTPELAGVMWALSAGFVVAGFRTVPDALLQKEMRFRSLALMDGGQAVLVALATMALAAAGARYWTLVAGTLLGGLLSAGMAVARRPQGFAVPRPRQVGPAMAFSGRLLISRLAWYLYSNADFMVVGKVLGQRALGAYNLAWSLAAIPVGKVSGMVMRVTPAYFSAVQDDPPALRRYLLRLTEGVALVTFPMTLGLAAVADDLVRVALGEKWLAAAVPLRLLAAYASLRSISPLLSQVLAAVGQMPFAMRNNLLAAVMLPAAFVVAAPYGVGAVAWAWILVHPLVLAPLLARTCSSLGMPVRDYFRALAPAAGGCAAMLAAVVLARLTTPAAWPLGARFAIEVTAGAATYALAILLFHRDRLLALRALLRDAPAA